MKKSVYEYQRYRDYLRSRLAPRGESRGMRKKLADWTQTRPAFITRVLSGEVHFSLEQAPLINEFLQHREEEAHFFTLLLLKDRAGSAALERYFQEQIDEVLARRAAFLDRAKTSDQVSSEDQALYYSQWYYLAIHVLLQVPAYRTREAIARRLGLSRATVERALQDLLRMGLVHSEGAQFQSGKKRIYLARNSPWIANLHSHFRSRALTRVADPAPEDLHFSAAMSVSREVYQGLRVRLLEFMRDLDSQVENSAEEEMYALNIDLFRY